MLLRAHYRTQELMHDQPSHIKVASDSRHHTEETYMEYEVEETGEIIREYKGLCHDCQLWGERGHPEVWYYPHKIHS